MPAIYDMVDLLKYISVDLQSPNAADNLLNRIISAISLLECTPNIGVYVQFKPYKLAGVRRLIVNDYIVFYKILNDEIHILRILASRQEWQDANLI